MSLEHFISNLFETGKVHVSNPTISSTITAADLSNSAARLKEFESQYGRDLPGVAPAYTPVAALWSASMLYRLCQALVFRDVGREQIDTLLGVPCPSPPNPSTIYSVDLSMRFLPDVHRLAKATNPADPFVEQLETLGRTWPLSSVGVDGTEPGSIDEIVADECLRMLYVDRVIALKDKSRLADPRVRTEVRRALGMHHSMAPETAHWIEEQTV